MDRDTALRQLAPVLLDCARALRRTGVRRAAVEELSPSEADTMRTVVRDPGVSPGLLAAELQMKPSNVSVMLRRLAELDLISRETDPGDRRAARVRPTAKAVDNARRIDSAWARLLDEVLADLAPEDADALLHAVPALQALEAALRGETRPRGAVPERRHP
jgi:DNA-binding MarR family transcriptional regulator